MSTHNIQFHDKNRKLSLKRPFFLLGWGGGAGRGRGRGYGPFKNISLISSRSFIKGERKPKNPGKDNLTIRKQNLAFPHVTRTRLEPLR